MAGLLGGCHSQPFVTPERLERGLVVILPGIEGRGILNEAIAHGLNDGGVQCAIEIYDWTSSLGPLYNLRAEEHNRKKAVSLARRITRYRIAHPDRPVIIVGHSGGGAMGVWALESLSPYQQVGGLILLNVSLSPNYDLSEALWHSQRGIVNIHSPLDWFLLGVGTSVYGTMDGKHEASAGMTGFVIPPGMPEAYVGFFQIGWTQKMAAAGHLGGHLSSSASKFIARYVAPLVKNPDWSPQLIDNIMLGLPDETSDSPTSVPAEYHPPSTQPKRDSDTNPAIKAVPVTKPTGKPQVWN